MLRDKSLIPLSHQHQHALGLCVRIDRAQPISSSELPIWIEEIDREFANEIQLHFSAEEALVFPAARNFSGLIALVEELSADHAAIRESLSQVSAHTMPAEGLLAFARQLSSHIRKEERQLFERMQELMTAEELSELGKKLESALKDASPVCFVPSEGTRLKAKK